jgi:beta-mannosidase
MAHVRSPVYRVVAAWVLGGSLAAAQLWTVRVEEPTGIERRTAEVVRVPLARLAGVREGYRVTTAEGRELPAQIAGEALLFPAGLMGGEVKEYRVGCCDPSRAALEPSVTARRLASGRFELRNSRVRLLIDPDRARIVEAYHLGAGPQRSLNLVETTPDRPDPDDIHHQPPGVTGPPSPVAGPNEGWSALGPPPSAEWRLESGALEGGIQRGGWSLRLDADSAAVVWHAPSGFRFASLSALPFLPFDRCVDGDESRWPDGPGAGEPPNHEVGARPWTQPPGGFITYYQRGENYGALTLLALDKGLLWSGACTSRLELRSPAPESALALLFHEWRGDETALEARSDARKLLRPLLVEVSAARQGALRVTSPLPAPPDKTAHQGTLPAPFEPPQLSLDGDWELAWGEMGQGPTSEWRHVRVPGSAHLQWLPKDEIYAPQSAWVSYKEWWYRRRFRVPPEFKGKALRLEFDATDYFGEAFLDGHRLGRHEGYIDPYGYDVTALLQPGSKHELRVRIWTPVHYYWRHRPYTIKGSYGGVDQKPDDITALGITRSVRLVAGQRARVNSLAVATRIEQGKGLVEVEADAEAGFGRFTWLVTLAPKTFAGPLPLQIRAPLRGSSERFEFRVRDPRLWWTWEHGRPDLYSLDVRLLDESGRPVSARRIAVGIRTVARRGDKFYLNGKPVFLRGTNVYANLWLSEMDRGAYQRDFALLRRMNINAIRVHCHFENPEFYELADEQGLLVWQDFLEAWYPHDTEFSRHAAALYDSHIRLVRNHACVFAWAPCDEEDLENYRDLSKHLAARASLLDPQDRWVQRSTGRWGDAHLYHGWYGGAIWDYTRMNENLVTELGATALPARASIEKFLKNKWPIPDYPDPWRYRRLQIAEAQQAWGDLRAMTLDQAIEKSQRYAALLFQIALERARRRKEEGAGGIFHFFAIDLWPSVTMAAIDFYRVPTRVFDTVSRSFAPVLASIEFGRDTWRTGEQIQLPVWAVNDLYEPVRDPAVVWRMEDDAGRMLDSGRWAVPIPEDSSRRVGEIRWSAPHGGRFRACVEVRSGERRLSENSFELNVLNGTR